MHFLSPLSTFDQHVTASCVPRCVELGPQRGVDMDPHHDPPLRGALESLIQPEAEAVTAVLASSGHHSQAHTL